MTRLLGKINSPADVKALSQSQARQLADEVRDELVKRVSNNGGHLASSLGAVELTIALHRVFDSPKDKIIWDVGHQAYTHKLITGRRKKFATLRQYGGLSGFTSRDESPHDPFGAGHASTSVSAAMGIAGARDLSGESYNVIAVIGDGAAAGGMALEAFNNISQLGSKLIVVLNDNGMSISPTVGTLDRLLSKVRLNKGYYRASESSKKMLKALPLGEKIWQVGQQVKSGVKGLVMPTVLWEEFGLAYIGPIDGHNISELEVVLKQARDYSHKPVLVHIITKKGKGYMPAEDDAICFHGVSPKAPPVKNGGQKQKTYSQVFGETMLELAEKDDKLVIITAAMPDSYCLAEIREKYPKRVFDVGICEQHAVTFAAGLATQGYKPVVAIYSTFLQRAFDQIIHDVCLQKLPVVFAIDRSGIVGEDGKTHQGTFDLSYLGLIPNLIVSAPKDAAEFKDMLYTALNQDLPMAIRYPRGIIPDTIVGNKFHRIDIGRGEILKHGQDVAILAIGNTVIAAMEAAKLLEAEGVRATVVNSRFAKPLDSELIIDMTSNITHLLTVEENIKIGGFGSSVLNLLNENNIERVRVKTIAIPDEFVEHGSQSILRAKYRMDAAGISEQVLKLLGKKRKADLANSNLYSSVK